MMQPWPTSLNAPLLQAVLKKDKDVFKKLVASENPDVICLQVRKKRSKAVYRSTLVERMAGVNTLACASRGPRRDL
jgi:exonuclease III